MEILKTLLLIKEGTDLEFFKEVVKDLTLTYQHTYDPEYAMDMMRQGNFSLLIIDKTLPIETEKKVDKLSNTLFPEAATISMFLNDKEFIHFKMIQIMHQWKEAQSDGGIKFYENPL